MRKIHSPLIIEQIEIEAKLRIPSRNNLDSLAHFNNMNLLLESEIMNVSDIYLDTSSSYLANKDYLFRIRTSTGKSRSTTKVSWKGSRFDNYIDTREDVSLLLPQNLGVEFLRFFGLLGYQPLWKINKLRRESRIDNFEYELDQNIKMINLQSKKEIDLGNFISVCHNISINCKSEELMNGHERIIRKISELSNFAQLESRSFVDLLMNRYFSLKKKYYYLYFELFILKIVSENIY